MPEGLFRPRRFEIWLFCFGGLLWQCMILIVVAIGMGRWYRENDREEINWKKMSSHCDICVSWMVERLVFYRLLQLGWYI
jgi:hypothetical protein